MIVALKVFKPFRGTYINIDYALLPRGIAGRVNAEIETTRKRKNPGFFSKGIVRINRRIKKQRVLHKDKRKFRKDN